MTKRLCSSLHAIDSVPRCQPHGCSLGPWSRSKSRTEQKPFQLLQTLCRPQGNERLASETRSESSPQASAGSP